MQGLLGLPNELLILIFDGFGEHELAQLARSCRRLHFCAIQLYIARYGFQDPTFLPSVTLSSESPNVLPALRLSLFPTSIGILRCKFHQSNFLGEARQLERLVLKLARLDELILDFTFVDYWALAFPRKGDAKLFLRHWIEIFEALFSSALRKTCSSVKVCGGRLYPAASQSHGIIGLEETFPWHERTPLLSMFRPGLDPFREALRLSPLSDPKGGSQLHHTLTRFHIHSSMLLYPTHCLWTIHILNNSPITDLSFMRLNLPASNWDNLLSCITVPTLSKLSIDFCNISSVTLSKFLSRHRHVSTLSLGEGIPYPEYMSSSVMAAFQSLTTLTAPTSYIVQLLSPISALPQLRLLSVNTSVTSLRNLLFYPYPGILNSHRLTADLITSTIARGVLFSMTLTIVDDDDLWLDLLVDEGYIGASHVLYDITRVVVWASPTILSTKMIAQFPVWLANFPRLQHIAFAMSAEVWEANRRTVALIQSIRDKCRNVEFVVLGDVEQRVSAWLGMRV